MSESTAAVVAAALRRSVGSERMLPLLRPIITLLAGGAPVTIGEIATVTDTPAEDVATALAAMGGVDYDEEGRIVGAGLTLRPTPHRFEVGGRRLFTWCAVDALAFPSILQTSARVESLCPATAVLIRLEVLPDRLLTVDPPGAVVSVVIPVNAAGADIRNGFCDHVGFFSSSEAAAPWLVGHPGGVVLPVAEAYELARTLTDDVLR